MYLSLLTKMARGRDFVVLGYDRFTLHYKPASLVAYTLEGTLIDTRSGADIVHLDTGY